MFPWIWADVVRRPADVVLDQVPPLEDRDLHQLRSHVDAHEVATDRPTVALPAPPPLQHLRVERHRPGRVALGLRAGRPAGLAAPLLAVARCVGTPAHRRSADEPDAAAGGRPEPPRPPRSGDPSRASAERARWPRRERAGVADLGLAHQRPLGRHRVLDPPFDGAIRQLLGQHRPGEAAAQKGRRRRPVVRSSSAQRRRRSSHRRPPGLRRLPPALGRSGRRRPRPPREPRRRRRAAEDDDAAAESARSARRGRRTLARVRRRARDQRCRARCVR